MGRSDALVLFVTLNLIQSRIIEQIARVEIILKPSELVGNTGSEAGMTHWRGLQGILSHVPPCSAVQNDDNIKPLRDTPHPDLPQSGEGTFITLNCIVEHS